MSNHWLQSFSGRAIDLIDVDQNHYTVKDIGTQLRRQPRFNGATSRPYSVLEHTLTGYHLFFDTPPNDGPSELGFAWLLHDAAEAFLGDMATPLKELCPGYQKVEARLAESIYAYFGADFDLWRSKELKEIDLAMLRLEKAALLPPEPKPWGGWTDWDDYDEHDANLLKHYPLGATDDVRTFAECIRYEVVA